MTAMFSSPRNPGAGPPTITATGCPPPATAGSGCRAAPGTPPPWTGAPVPKAKRWTPLMSAGPPFRRPTMCRFRTMDMEEKRQVTEELRVTEVDRVMEQRQVIIPEPRSRTRLPNRYGSSPGRPASCWDLASRTIRDIPIITNNIRCLPPHPMCRSFLPKRNSSPAIIRRIIIRTLISAVGATVAPIAMGLR
jgi:hypothetical protein